MSALHGGMEARVYVPLHECLAWRYGGKSMRGGMEARVCVEVWRQEYAWRYGGKSMRGGMEARVYVPLYAGAPSLALSLACLTE
jgi:hypothetical protein